MMGYVTALVPSLGVLLIFWIAIRAMVQADRRERIAQARIELAERAADEGEGGAAGLGQMGDATDKQPGHS